MVHSKDPSVSETENAIFRAAIDVFAERGKAGARMQEIADRAGINKALVHYFRSKDKLYEEAFSYIVRTHFRLLACAVEEAPDFESQLRKFISTYMDILEQNPVLIPFMTRELNAGATVMRARLSLEFAADTFPPKLFIKAMERAIRKKEIRSSDPIQTLITLLGSCIYFFLALPLLSVIAPQIETNPARFSRQRRNHLFDLVYYGLKPRRGADS